MKNKTTQLTRKLARFSYLLGISSMLVAMFLSIVSQPALAEEDPCGSGFEEKFEGPFPYTYTTPNEGYVISQVIIKAGTQCIVFTEDVNECYDISGIGTDTVYIGGGGTSNECKAISHVLIYTTLPKPTPTEPTPTEPTPTEPTPTEPTPTEPTPTEPTPTEPTPTEPTPTEPTPTEPTPTEPTPTEPTPTEPTPTEPTPTEPTPTEPTPTEPTPTEPTPTDPTPTESPVVTETPPIVTETPVSSETPVASETPVVTETAVVTETPAVVETPEPTLPPPQQVVRADQPALLVPVTGADLSLGTSLIEWLQRLLGSLGLAFIGIGLVFTGMAKREDE